MKIALTLAATLFAASSFAFAADNNGGKDGMKNNSDTTGSIQSNTSEPPTQKMIDDCKTAPADDLNCKNIMDAR